jgi:hypothetical protein
MLSGEMRSGNVQHLRDRDRAECLHLSGYEGRPSVIHEHEWKINLEGWV